MYSFLKGQFEVWVGPLAYTKDSGIRERMTAQPACDIFSYMPRLKYVLDRHQTGGGPIGGPSSGSSPDHH